MDADAAGGGEDGAVGVGSAGAGGRGADVRVLRCRWRRAPLPWQVVQVSVEVSMAPFTCRPPATLTTPAALTVPPWQLAQVVSAAALWWLAVPGGDLWQLPQSAATRCSRTRGDVPRVVVALSEEPWQ